MSERTGAGLTLLIGTVLLRLSVTDLYRRYVRTGMRPWLILAGLVLVVLGGLGLRSARTRTAAAHDEADHDQGHSHRSTVALLLLLPIVVVFLVAPAPLGSFAATRAPRPPAPVRPAQAPPPLPEPRNGAVDLTLTEYGERLAYGGTNFEGVIVRLSGFVTPDPTARDGFLLTRFRIACCAADARPVQVAVRGIDGPMPRRDTWVEVLGHVDDSQPTAAVLVATALRRLRAPEDPYE